MDGDVRVMRERRHLLNVAYRLLGSLTDAEDAVQEAYARWYAMPAGQRDLIESPGAWLTTVVGRVCLDVLGSARARRERYVGEWLPEPLPGDARTGAGTGTAAADPAERVALDESVSMALLVVLDEMTPAERVAFVLHDVYGYAFAEIAEVVGRTPAACRQLAASARRRTAGVRERQAPAADRAAVVRGFKAAWEAGDIEALMGLLDPDAVMIADGGGLVRAAQRPIEGGERIVRYALELASRMASGARLREALVNGEPGLVIEQDGAVGAVLSFGIGDGRVRRVWAVRNPEKLGAWTRP